MPEVGSEINTTGGEEFEEMRAQNIGKIHLCRYLITRNYGEGDSELGAVHWPVEGYVGGIIS